MRKFLLNIILKIAGIAVLLLAAKRDGKNEAVREQLKDENELLQTRLQLADAMGRLTPSARRRLLDKWASGVQRVDTDTTDKQ